MLKFDEAKLLEKQQKALEVIAPTEKLVDAICEKGFSNVFYIGIGGTVLYAGQMMHIMKQLGSKLPLYVENAADFTIVSHPLFSKDSLVVIESASGDTKEVVQAVEKIHEVGAKVLAFVEKAGTPLAEKADYLVQAAQGGMIYWYTVTLRLMKNRGEFDQYDQFFAELKNFPENWISIAKAADEAAHEYAEMYCDEALTYLVGSGNLEDFATLYGMCIMEEMQWMPTRPISASNFFHGTLEVIERDIPVILIKGEDMARPLMERVEKFVHTICDNVIVFDTKDYALKGMSDEFRGLLSPLVISAAFSRVSVHLENERKHPLEIRRYYRALEY